MTTAPVSRLDRADYTAGLRFIADAIDADDTLPLPEGHERLRHLSISVHVYTRVEMQAWVCLLDEIISQEQSGGNYYVHGRIDGLHLCVFAGADTVGTITTTIAFTEWATS